MDSDEKRELLQILEERTMSDWHRRRRRLLAAEARLREMGNFNLADIVERARSGKPLTTDQFIVANFGFLPGEYRREPPETPVRS